MADANTDDIRRVLRVCFRDGNPLSDIDIERILSFDMGWISPQEAENAVKALIDKGWLTGENQSLLPVIDDQNISTPLGWFPRPSRLTNPVEFNSTSFEIISVEEEIPTENIPQPETTITAKKDLPKTDFSDPRAKLEQRLKKFISKSSKLPIEEIERRTSRKKQALGMVSEWMCLALVAREQGLLMNQIVDALK